MKLKHYLLLFVLLMTSLSRAQIVYDFSTPPTIIDGNPWDTEARINIGGVDYVITTFGNGSISYQTTGGAGGSASLRKDGSGGDSFSLKRVDGQSFKFQGMWVAHTSMNSYSSFYSLPPWYTITYHLADGTTQTDSDNTPITAGTAWNNYTSSAITYTKDLEVNSVSINFKAILHFTIDNIKIGEASKVNQSFSFPEIAEKTYGDDSFVLGDEFSSAELTITYTAEDPSVVQITGNSATVLKAGSTEITATQVGNDTVFAATEVSRTLTVNKKDLLVTAQDQNLDCAESAGPLLYSISGFENSDTVEDLDNTGFDLSTSYTAASGVGVYPVNISAGTATDDNYTLTGFESGSITVTDTTPPVVLTQNIIVQLDDTGTINIAENAVDNGSSDACDEAPVFDTSITSFNSSHLGAPVTVTLKVTDNSGNFATATATVTVEDNLPPMVACPADITINAETENCGAVVSFGTPKFYATSNGQNLMQYDLTTGESESIGSFGYSNTFALTFTPDGRAWTVINGYGAAQLAEVDLTTGAATPVGNPFGFTSISIDSDSEGQLYVVGYSSNSNLYKVNKDTGIATLVGATGLTNTMDLAFDANDKLWAIKTDGFIYSIDTTTATLTRETSVLGVISNEMSLAISPDNTFYLAEYSRNPRIFSLDPTTGETSFVANISVPYPHGGDIFGSGVTATDNTGDVSVVQTAGLPSGSVFPVGTTVNTFVATDGSGNSSTCSFNVIVEDKIAPVVVTKNFTVQLDAEGNASITPELINNNSTDACGITSYSFSEGTAYSTASEGGTLSISLPAGAVVTSVDFASYGLPSGTDGNYSTGWCHAADSKAIVESYALGKNSFSIPATNDVFGDPCVGTGKRLYVSVAYKITTMAFSCSDLGDHEVTLKVTDASGNSSTAAATVTVEDNIAPALTTKAFTLQLDANGSGSIVASDVVDSSSDNCETLTFTLSKDSFDCSNVGANVIEVTATDASENETTVEATVTVEDNIAPALTTKAFTLQLDANGSGSIVASDVVDSSSDNCGTLTFTLSKDSFDCSNVGANVIEVTATDASENETTVEATVTVEDNIAPALTTKAFTLQLDANGSGSIVASDVVDSSSDNCGTLTFTLSKDSFDCSNVGANVIEVTATDASENETTVEATVTVEDNIAPALTTKAFTLQLDANGSGSIVASEVVDSSSDNCETLTFTLSKDSFDCSNVGANVIEVTATDASENETTVEATVTVEDNIAPALTTKAFTLQLDANGSGSIIASDVVDSSSDNCGTLTFTLSKDSFDCSNVGANVIEVTATDVSENKTTVEATVTVEDNIAPALTTKAFTLQLDANGSGSIIASDVVDSSSDNCGTLTFTLSKDSFDCSNVGANVIEVTATDVSENKTTVEATVTVEDNIAPALTTKAFTLQLDANGSGSIVASDVVDSSSDNCETLTFTLSKGSFDCSNVGANVIEVTATDASENETTVEATVTVEDNIAPALTTKAFTLQLNANGSGSIVASDVVDSSSDNCETLTFTLSKDSFDCSNVGANVIEVTATDASENETTVEATVTVEDNIDPALITKAFTLQLDANGSGSIVASDVVDSSSDNCETLTFTLSKDSFDCSNVGANVIEVTATDASENETTVEATVTVEDNIAPALITKAFTLQLDANGSGSIVASDVVDSSSDNCETLTFTLSKDNFDCSNVGANVIEVTATDASENETTVEATVTVEDNVDPVAVTKNITVQLDADGNASITPEMINNGSSDACGIATLALDIDSFNCANVGENIVVLTVTDKNGSSSSAEATVTVEDNISPIAVAQNITVQLDADGNASITPEMIDNGSSDACGISTLALDIDSFNCANVGENVVVLTVTDKNGNSSSAEATVTVEDYVDPVAVTKNITVQLDADGNASITPKMIDNGSSDACGIATLALDIDSFNCANVGDNTVVLTVTDKNGNSSSAEATVTVEDNVDPVAVTKNITVQLDAEGHASITPKMIDNGSSDACGIATLALNIDSFNCANVGENTVTLTVTDKNGNFSTSEATVSVEDNVDPVAVTKNITVQLDADGNASITPEMINNGSSDACGIATLALDIDSFNCANVGENTVVLTVTDKNGNSSSAEATVTVEDNVDPVAVTKNITVQLDAEGHASITPKMIDNGSSDACGIATLALDIESFNCANVGENVVVLTVTDKNGNSSSAEATVTVEDNISPIAVAQNITVQLDAEGHASITPEMIDNGSSDACGIAILALDIDSFNCANVGENVVVLTITDKNGNSSSAEATVTVEDNISPIAVAQNITVQLDAEGHASITPEMIDNGSSDACGIAILALDIDSFNCANVGENFVVLTVTDKNGNSSSAEATVTVEDNVDPVAVTKNITVQLDADGNASITPEMIDSGSSDVCDDVELSLDIDSFSCGNVGKNSVLLTVTDKNGNSSSAEASVTVEDNIAPVVITRDLSVILDASGMISITPEQINDGSLDNCEIASYSLDRTSFSCTDTGENFLVLTVTDIHGNTASAEAIVTVQNNAGDNDVDGLLDNCDEDDDNDGIVDTEDNAPKDYNPDQTDSDGDGEGDIIDLDSDNDGINDSIDNCPVIYNPGQEDIDKDGLGDVCDTVQILAAEGLTPNSDGVNDTWIIHNLENHPKSVVRVYNRWGNEVFSSRNYKNDWNGEFEGNLLPEGSYYFQIDLGGNGTLDRDGWLYLTK